MHVLPAVVPEGEFPRAEIVAVRLARKVGPLFGVRWAHEPYGRTWVCDFGALTLAEIARGAPMPPKEEQTRLDAHRSTEGSDRWDVVGRAVWTPGRAPAPAALANATLNRFGPDTKAAVVLTAANRLLDDASRGIATVCEHLARTGVARQVGLAIWAGLTLEAFRGQPALVVAAIQARSVQRSLTTRWGSQLALGGLGATSARCEIGAPRVDEGEELTSPVRFDLIDDTLDALFGCATPAGGAVGAVGSAVGVDRREDIAAAWCRRLLQMGRPGSGLVWLAEQGGHRVAHSYQRVGAMVAPFVSEVAEPPGRGTVLPLPPWPAKTELDTLDVPAVRAHAVAAHVAAGYLRYADRLAHEAPAERRRGRGYVDEAATATIGRLGLGDPAALLLAGYRDYLRLLDATDAAADPETLAEHVETLVAGQRRTVTALRDGSIDPGAASYLLEIGNVALGQARPRLPDDAAVTRALARTWREALVARGTAPEPAAQLAELNDSQVFHLANYAEYLTTRPAVADLRRALRILAAVAEVRDRVAAKEPAALLAKHVAGREAHLLAAGAAAGLGRALPRDGAAAGEAWAAAAGHVRAALRNPSFTELSEGDWDDEVAWLALHRMGPGLARLLDDGDLHGHEREQARRLVDALLARSGRRRRPPEDGARVAGLRELRARLTGT